MNTTLENIEQAVKQLSVNERAALAHNLLKGLDEADGDEKTIESLWAVETEDRLDAYLKGEIEASPVAEVIERVKSANPAMTVRFLSVAEEEFFEAAAYYEEMDHGLGDRFIEHITNSLSHIEQNPYFGSVIQKRVRKVSLLKFPYNIIYYPIR